MLITLQAERVSFKGNNQTSTTPNESTVNKAKYVPSTGTVPPTTTNDIGPNINTAKLSTTEKSTNPPVDLTTASGKFKTSHTTNIHIQTVESCSSYCDSCGTWNNNTCAYDCAAGFYGANCTSQCSTMCKNGAEVNETDCGCLCNEKQYGSLCDCRYPYTGGYCDVCKVGTCENCGTFNPATCRCDCLAGYGGLQCELSCADKANSTFCAAAVAAGDCVNNNIFMEEYCMLSCGLCTAQCPAADCSQPSRTGMTSKWCQCDKFTCVNNFGCIETTQVNDGVIDCPDGSDEPVGVVSSGSQGQASSKNVEAGGIAAIGVVVAVVALAATGAILYLKVFRKTPVKSLKKRPSTIFPSKTTGNGAPPVKMAFKKNGVPKQAF